MTKQTEAMKLALEAQSYAVACLLNQLSTKDKHAYAVEKLNTSTADLQEALAQPTSAPVQLPQGWSVVLVTGADTKVWPMTEEQIQAAAFSALGLAEQPAQQEPVAQPASVEDMKVYQAIAANYHKDLAPPAQQEPLPKGEWPKHPSPYVNDQYRGYLNSDLDDYAMWVLAAHGIKENT